MKKQVKKLKLKKETLRELEESGLEKVLGAIDTSRTHPCKPDSFWHCSTMC